MTNPKTILRDSALVLPILAGAGGVVDGGVGAATVLAGGLLALVNFAAMAWAVSQLMDGEPQMAPVAVGVLVIKTTVFLGGAALLMMALDPMLVGLGLLSLVTGLMLTLVVRIASPESDADGVGTPSPMLAEEA